MDPSFLILGMDYKEVVTKSGSTIVFCHFEDLLTEAYGVSSMDLVEPNANSNGEYIIHCPFCKAEGHTKHKLYIKSDLSVGFCFVCCRRFVNVTDKISLEVKSPTFFPGMYRDPFHLVKLEDQDWSLDRFKYEFDDFDQRGYDYLVKRNPYLADLYKILGFKFVDGNIAMPFYYHGELFYYQIRFTGSSKIRYYFPPISAKSPWILEHGSNKNFIIVEGIYDAIAALIMAPEYTPCAVLGSSISDYQIEFLREYVPDKILIYMDKTDISKRIAQKLRTIIDYCPIKIIPSDGEDPEECMRRRIKEGRILQWIR